MINIYSRACERIVKKALFIDFWNCTPHLETSFELIKDLLDTGYKVTYIFCGHAVPYKEGIVFSPNEALFRSDLPEAKGVKLLNSKNLIFISPKVLPLVNYPSKYDFIDIEDLKSFKYKNFEVGISVASSLISLVKNSNLNVDVYRNEILQMIDSAIRVYEFTINIINNTNPDEVYLFNGRFCNHRAVMRAAVESNIKLFIHERGATKLQYDLTTYMSHDQNKAKDRILEIWDGVNKDVAARKIGSDFFEDRRLGKEQQGKSYTDKHQKGLLPTFDKSKKIITFFSSSDYEFEAVGDIFKWEGWKNQFDAVLDLIDICKKKLDCQLIIRLHPNLADVSFDDRECWMSLKNNPDIIFISYDTPVDSYALIENSDLIVNAGSTIGVEAVYWGKPSLTLGPAFYSSMGATYGAKSYKELQTIIDNVDSLNVNVDGALAFGYFINTFGINYKHYVPITFNSGKFLGVDLQSKSQLWRWWAILKGILRRRLLRQI